MRKWICGLLSAVTVLLVLSSCASQNITQIDAKLCYLEDSQMELLTPKNTVVEKKGLVYSEEYSSYSYPEEQFVTIDDTSFLASFTFNSEDILASAFYIPVGEDSSTPQMDEMKKYLDSVYGESEEYSNEYGEEGYSWTTETERGTYQVALIKYDSQLFRIDVKGITGDVRTDSQKRLDDVNSQLTEKWEDVGEAASQYYEEIQDSSGVTFYEIEPESGLISQKQFDSLKDGMTYQEAMEALGASENPEIPFDASYFCCKWENSSSFVMLLYFRGRIDLLSIVWFRIMLKSTLRGAFC